MKEDIPLDEALRRLRETEALLEAVLANSPDLIFVLDRQFRVQALNRDLLGRPRAEFIGAELPGLLPE